MVSVVESCNTETETNISLCGVIALWCECVNTDVFCNMNGPSKRVLGVRIGAPRTTFYGPVSGCLCDGCYNDNSCFSRKFAKNSLSAERKPEPLLSKHWRAVLFGGEGVEGTGNSRGTAGFTAQFPQLASLRF